MVETKQYDVAIVGASLAGSAAATLFARAGARVALIERDPKPTAFKRLCTHSIHSSATPAIQRLGLAEAIERAGGRRIELEIWTRWGWIRDPGTPTDRPDHGYNIRREKLDPMVRQLAASTPGVDLMPGWSAQEVLTERKRPCGVRIEGTGGASREVRARLVVGADGRHSRIAELAGIAGKIRPHRRFAYYAYYRDIPMNEGSTCQTWFLDPDWAGAFASDDGHVVVGAMLPQAKLAAWKSDLEGSLLRLFDGLPQAPLVREGKRVSPFLGMLEMPNVERPPAAPGIAFIGDAALAADPLWGVGCGFAFQSAEWLVDAVATGLDDRRALDRGLRAYAKRHRHGLAGHEFLMADYATGRRFNMIEKLMYSSAARDPVCAANLLSFGTRNIGPARFLSPRALARAMRVNLAHAWRGEPVAARAGAARRA